MTAKEYKSFKGLRKENLRDNMSDIEVAIANIGEIATRNMIRKERPIGLKENRKVAKRGGKVARKTKEIYENETGLNAISKDNSLNYEYIEDNELISK